MNLLALDQATRCSGYSVFQEGKLVKSGTFTITYDDMGERLVAYRNKVQSLIEEYNIDTVVFENIQMQGQVNNVDTFKKLAEVYGVTEELLTRLRIPHTVLGASQWRSTLGIKGTVRAVQKKNAQDYILQHYGKKASQDESDAICIGAAYLNKEESAF